MGDRTATSHDKDLAVEWVFGVGFIFTDDIRKLVRDGDDSPVLAASGADALVGRPLSDVEKYYIQRALELTDGKREEAASILGIGERTLYRKIKEYGLKSP